MGRMCNVYVSINGLYVMGDGWAINDGRDWEEVRRYFRLYFDMNKFPQREGLRMKNQFRAISYGEGISHRHVLDNGGYGDLYVHPMEITGLLHSSNSSEDEMFEYELQDLALVLDGLVDFMKETCGINMSYRINYAVAPYSRELYDWKKF